MVILFALSQLRLPGLTYGGAYAYSTPYSRPPADELQTVVTMSVHPRSSVARRISSRRPHVSRLHYRESLGDSPV
jgi:hypothetical protein